MLTGVKSEEFKEESSLIRCKQLQALLKDNPDDKSACLMIEAYLDAATATLISNTPALRAQLLADDPDDVRYTPDLHMHILKTIAMSGIEQAELIFNTPDLRTRLLDRPGDMVRNALCSIARSGSMQATLIINTPDLQKRLLFGRPKVIKHALLSIALCSVSQAILICSTQSLRTHLLTGEPREVKDVLDKLANKFSDSTVIKNFCATNMPAIVTKTHDKAYRSTNSRMLLLPSATETSENSLPRMKMGPSTPVLMDHKSPLLLKYYPPLLLKYHPDKPIGSLSPISSEIPVVPVSSQNQDIEDEDYQIVEHNDCNSDDESDSPTRIACYK